MSDNKRNWWSLSAMLKAVEFAAENHDRYLVSTVVFYYDGATL